MPAVPSSGLKMHVNLRRCRQCDQHVYVFTVAIIYNIENKTCKVQKAIDAHRLVSTQSHPCSNAVLNDKFPVIIASWFETIIDFLEYQPKNVQ